MIICDTENFSVDDSWIANKAHANRPLADELVVQEKEMIEAALAETRGRVSGTPAACSQAPHGRLHPGFQDQILEYRQAARFQVN